MEPFYRGHLQDRYFDPLQKGGCFKQVVLHRICPTETNCNSHNSGGCYGVLCRQVPAWPLPVDRNNSEMSFSDGSTPFVSATSPSYRPTARYDEWGACCSDTAEDSGSTETVDRAKDGGSTPRPQEEESQEEGEGR